MSVELAMIISFGSIGLLFIVLGGLIRFKKQLTLIAGINNKNKNEIKDPEGLAKSVGLNVILMGIAGITAPFVAFILNPESVYYIYTGAILVMVAVLIIRSRKYIK